MEGISIARIQHGRQLTRQYGARTALPAGKGRRSLSSWVNHSVNSTQSYMRKSLLEAYVARAEGGTEVPFIHRDVLIGVLQSATHSTHIQRLPTTTTLALAPNSTHSRPPQKQKNSLPSIVTIYCRCLPLCAPDSPGFAPFTPLAMCLQPGKGTPTPPSSPALRSSLPPSIMAPVVARLQ